MGFTSLSQIPLPHAVPRGRCQHAGPLLKLHNEISWYPLVKQLFETSQPTLCSLIASAGGCGLQHTDPEPAPGLEALAGQHLH